MRFPISFGGLSKTVFTLIGCGPGASGVEIDATTIRARMGWFGSVAIPRESIASIRRAERVPFWRGVGVHGGFGRWAINGSNRGVVQIDLKGPARGRVLVFPFQPRTLYLSLEDPEGFIRAASRAA